MWLSHGTQVLDGSLIDFVPGLEHFEGWTALPRVVDSTMIPLHLEPPTVGGVSDGGYIQVDRSPPRVTSEDGEDPHEGSPDLFGKLVEVPLCLIREIEVLTPIGKPKAARHLSVPMSNWGDGVRLPRRSSSGRSSVADPTRLSSREEAPPRRGTRGRCPNSPWDA